MNLNWLKQKSYNFKINSQSNKAQLVNSKQFRSSNNTLDHVKENCKLIWEGKTKTRAFRTFRQEIFTNELTARDVFRNASVEHYWDTSFTMVFKENFTNELTARDVFRNAS